MSTADPGDGSEADYPAWFRPPAPPRTDAVPSSGTVPSTDGDAAVEAENLRQDRDGLAPSPAEDLFASTPADEEPSAASSGTFRVETDGETHFETDDETHIEADIEPGPSAGPVPAEHTPFAADLGADGAETPSDPAGSGSAEPAPEPDPEPVREPVEVPDPPVTGDDNVDVALSELADVMSMSLEDQLVGYEQAHRVLQDRLADVEG